MKTFLTQNWYRLILATSLFIFSLGFFISAVSPVKATPPNQFKNGNAVSVGGTVFVGCGSGIYYLRDYVKGTSDTHWILVRK